MIKSSMLALAAMVGIGVVVTGVDATTFATTGHSLLLGHVNTSDARTTIVRHDEGSALYLETGSSSPPVRVTSSARVVHLNADYVDGLSAGDLRPTAQTYVLPVEPYAATLGFNITAKPGIYEVIFQSLFQTSSPDVHVRCILSSGKLPPGPSTNAYANFLHAFGAEDGSLLQAANGSSVFTLIKSDPSINISCATDLGKIATVGSQVSRVILIPMSGQTTTQIPAN